MAFLAQIENQLRTRHLLALAACQALGQVSALDFDPASLILLRRHFLC
jgi:alkylhydroperoxidase/carboxymuconolactone decarboxylase family protein YurZ